MSRIPFAQAASVPVLFEKRTRQLGVHHAGVDLSPVKRRENEALSSTNAVNSSGPRGFLWFALFALVWRARRRNSAWQGMQHMRHMFNGRAKLEPLDNDRYPTIRWTTTRRC